MLIQTEIKPNETVSSQYNQPMGFVFHHFLASSGLGFVFSDKTDSHNEGHPFKCRRTLVERRRHPHRDGPRQ